MLSLRLRYLTLLWKLVGRSKFYFYFFPQTAGCGENRVINIEKVGEETQEKGEGEIQSNRM